MSQTFTYDFGSGNVLNVTTADVATNDTGYGLGFNILSISGTFQGVMVAGMVGTGGVENIDFSLRTYYNDVVFTGDDAGVAGSTYGIDIEGIDFATVDGAHYDLFMFGFDRSLNYRSSSQIGSATPLSTNAPCYCRGTRILTSKGEMAIEDLGVGDWVVTASGAHRPVKWIGHRRIDCRRHPEPLEVWPVRVAAGAFGEGRPARDLWMSPGHNVVAEGVLMRISGLANGVSVAQEPRDGVEYWHVELESHDILLAEGLEAESYLDTGNRGDFFNGGAFLQAHPDFAPRHWRDTCLPLVEAGPEIDRAKADLIARAGICVTSDADLHVLADGARIEPVWLAADRAAFTVPADSREIVLSSRTFVPAHMLPESRDVRDLGVDVKRLQIDGNEIALEGLSDGGWSGVERDGETVHRWTTGATALPAGSRLIVLDLHGCGHYRLPRRDNVVDLFAPAERMRMKA